MVGKYIKCILFIIIGSTAIFANEIKEQDFYIQIKLIVYEQSKDSNSQHYSVVEVKTKLEGVTDENI